MALTGGYLVVYHKDDVHKAVLYDEYLNQVSDLDPSSEDALEHMSHAEEIGGLEDDMWEDVLADLTLQQRSEAVAYRLENEVLNPADYQIEDVMEHNDDEESPGYNG